MTERVETTEGREPEVPFKSRDELIAMHGGDYTYREYGPRAVGGVFRTELPDQQINSITFAEVIPLQRDHTWNVRIEDGADALLLIEILYEWHRHALDLNLHEVGEIIAQLDKLDLRKPKSGGMVLSSVEQ